MFKTSFHAISFSFSKVYKVSRVCKVSKSPLNATIGRTNVNNTEINIPGKLILKMARFDNRFSEALET